MQIFPLLKKNNNETERNARNEQRICGHAGHEQDFETWLKEHYAEHGLFRRRYTSLAHSYLDTAQALEVLEIGSATGDLSVFFYTLFPQHHYTVHDISRESLERFFPISRTFFKVDTEFKQAVFFAEDIPLSESSFDIIFIKAAVHHFEDPRKAFSEIRRILRPGGKVVFINDGVSLSLPIIGFLQKMLFARAEKAQGFNEHLYSLHQYVSFGKGFKRVEWQFDPFYVNEIEVNTSRRGRFKSIVWHVARYNSWVYRTLFTYRFPSAFIFCFTK